MSEATIISKGMRARKLDLPSCEFTGQRHWCRRCQQDTDSTAEHGRANGVNVYRKVCRRCGWMTHYGVDLTQLRVPTPTVFETIRRWIKRQGVHP